MGRTEAGKSVSLFVLIFFVLFSAPLYAGFVPVNLPGFGDDDYAAASLVDFPPFLAAGTYDSVQGGQVWLSRDGHHWTNSSGSGGGFGNSDNQRVFSLVRFQGQLYAGTYNFSTGAQVWRSATGTGWVQTLTGGLDSSSYGTVILFSNSGTLLAGFSSGWAPASRIARSMTGALGTWQTILSTTNGFGDPDNYGVSAFVRFQGRVYAGTRNGNTGSQIWSSADMTNWSLSSNAKNGFGSLEGPPRPQTVTAFVVFSNRIYAAGDDGSLHRSPDGVQWEKVRNGAGWMGSLNALAVYDGALWSCGTDPAMMKALLVRSSDGSAGSWTVVNNDGWKTANTPANLSFAVWSNALFVGTESWMPEARVWSDLLFDYIVLERTADLAERFVPAGSSNHAVLAFRYKDTFGHPLSRLSVSNRGNTDTNDILALRLWADNDQDGTLSVGDTPVPA